MATLTLKNIPEDVYQRLRQQAAANRRSLNSEIITCLEQAVRSEAIEPEQILATARRIREKTSPYRIDDDEFSRLKDAGRP